MKKTKDLRQLADRVEDFTYSRKLTEEEMEQLRVELMDESIRLKELNDDYKEKTRIMRDEIKPVKYVVDLLIDKLSKGEDVVTTECAVIFNHESNKAIYIDLENGIEVFERDLRLGEMQTTLQGQIRSQKGAEEVTAYDEVLGLPNVID